MLARTCKSCRCFTRTARRRSVRRGGGSYAKAWPDRHKKQSPTPSVWWSWWLNSSGNVYLPKRASLLHTWSCELSLVFVVLLGACVYHDRNERAVWTRHWNEMRISWHRSSFTSSSLTKQIRMWLAGDWFVCFVSPFKPRSQGCRVS